MHIYQFDAFEFHTHNFVLLRNDTNLGIRPKAALLLLTLLEHPNQLLTKDVLLHSVWQDCYVSDAVLFQTMAELRKFLGTHSRGCKFIRNVKGQGYLWIYEPLQVTTVALELPTHEPAPVDQPPAVSAPVPRRRQTRLWRTLAAIATIALITWFASRPSQRPDLRQRATQLNLRVLPFRDETGQPEIVGLLPGLAELVSWQLAKHGGVLTDLSALPRQPEERDASPESLLAKSHCLAVLSSRFHLVDGHLALSASLDTSEFPAWEKTVYGANAWDCVRALNRALAMRLGIRPPTTGDPFISEQAARLFAAGEQARLATATEDALAAYQRALLIQPDQDLFRLSLAAALARVGQPQRAQTLVQEALAHAELQGSPSLIRACLETQALLEHERGDLEARLVYHRRILAACRRWGVPPRLVDRIALAEVQALTGAFTEAKASLTASASPLTLQRGSAFTPRLELTYYHCSLELDEQVHSNLNALEDSFRLEHRHQAALRARILASRRALRQGDETLLTELLAQICAAEAHDLEAMYLDLFDLATALRDRHFPEACLKLQERLLTLSTSQTAYARARLALARSPALIALKRMAEARAELSLCADFLATTHEPEEALGFGLAELERLQRLVDAQP